MPAPAFKRALVWFRRDLRADDHAALHAALTQAVQVWCVFVFDQDILDPLPRTDRRVEFILGCVHALDGELRGLARTAGGGGLLVRQGRPGEEIPALAQALGVQAVFASHDDEPEALARDADVGKALQVLGVAFNTLKDHVVLERSEVLTAAGRPYGVFSPYKRAWLKALQPRHLAERVVARHAQALAAIPAAVATPVPTLRDIGFESTNLAQLPIHLGADGAQQTFAEFLSRMDAYDQARDFPAVKGPSYLSVHLRFGTISIRQLARQAQERAQAGSKGAQVWLSELIWRDFYHQVMHHHPRVVTRSFRPEYDAIAWEQGAHADALFAAWCDGRTGYPLVDAAMAQINQTGYMHNRLRMVVASFLVKDLGLDWRRGEHYFARQLNDFDLAANNGGWQWASSSGCDAQPYFRIFNPVTQSEKFDAQGSFIRRYLPQLADLPDRALHAPWMARPADLAAAGVRPGENYPLPIVAHDEARQRTLARYAVVKRTGR